MLASQYKFEDALRGQGGGTSVRYSCEVLEELRRMAVDGLNAFTRGGLEIGGVLYGRHKQDTLTVLAFAELPCEHALGPRFVLSDNDRQRMLELMDAPAGLETIGWFRTHTRGGVELDADDRRTFDQYFSHRAGTALILKPSNWGPASAAFFVREATGQVVPESPQVFTVEPMRAPVPADAPEQELATKVEAPLTTPRPSSGDTGELQETEPPRVEEMPVPAHAELPGPSADGPLVRLRAVWARRTPTWAIAAAAALVAVLGLGYWASRPRVFTSASELQLQVMSVGRNQVKISWNRRAAAVLSSNSGTLTIEDGASRTKMPLDAAVLRSSTVTYTPHNRHLTVRFRVEGSGLPEDVVQFHGLLPFAAPVETAQKESVPSLQAKVVLEPVGEPDERKDSATAVTPEKPQASRSMPAVPPVQPKSEAQRPPALPLPPAIEPGATATANVRELPSAFRSPAPLPPPIAPAPAAPPPVTTATSPAATVSSPAGGSPAPAVAPSNAAVRTGYTGPRSGRFLWTGVLGRRGVMEIDGANVSTGSVTGHLPGVPLAVRVYPAEFTNDGLVVYTADRARAGTREPASKANGWNALQFKYDEARSKELVVLEAPNRLNEFGRLVVRNEGRGYSVVVVDWSAQ